MSDDEPPDFQDDPDGTQRKALYRALRSVADSLGRRTDLLLEEILSVQLGTDYLSVARRGRMSVSRAKRMHAWLAGHHYAIAAAAAPELFPIEPESVWALFLRDRGHRDGVSVVPLEGSLGIVQRAADVQKPDALLRLGQNFTFRVMSPWPGQAVAFQEYNRIWHPLPLGRNARHPRATLTTGPQYCPRFPNGDPVPLVEQDHTGDHRFVFVLSCSRPLPLDQPGIMKAWSDSAMRVLMITLRIVA
ncbi:hypothetical protein DXV76_03590 [Rhodobacteraceae bacterium CCMM004]|nr:hypothetical protein DXV76_03590 [Rhodobacteraceae bacterium CCMM004]